MASITIYPSACNYDRSINWNTSSWAKVTQDSDSSAYNGGWASRVGGGYRATQVQYVTWIPFPTGASFLDPAKYVITAATFYLYQGYAAVSDMNNISACNTTMRARGGKLTPSGTNALSSTVQTVTTTTGGLSSASDVGYKQYSFSMLETAKALQNGTANGIYIDLANSSNATWYSRLYSGYNSSGTQYKTTQSPRFVLTYSDRSYTLSVPEVEGATVSEGGSKTWGSPVTISCTPDPGYKFVKWVLSDRTESTDSTYTFTMPTADVTATAVVERQGTVSAIVDGVWTQCLVHARDDGSAFVQCIPHARGDDGAWKISV